VLVPDTFRANFDNIALELEEVRFEVSGVPCTFAVSVDVQLKSGRFRSSTVNETK